FELSEFNAFHYGFNNPVQAPNQGNNFDSNVRPNVTTGDAFSAGGSPALKDAFLSINVSPYFKQPYIHEWTFGIQTEINPSLGLEVRYVGLSAIQMSHFRCYGNQPFPGTGPAQDRRVYPDFGFSCTADSGANSNYNSLQAQLTKKMSQGLSFIASYTWAKSISDNEGEEGGYVNGGANLGQNDNNIAQDRARSYLDTRHRFVFSSMYELPFGKGRRWASKGGALTAVAGGWEVSTIASFQTGFPVSTLSGFDFANVTQGGQRPDRTCNGNLPAGDRTVERWFDTGCFTTEFLAADLAAGRPRFGNSGRNIMDGPGIQNWDFGIIRDFQLRERLKMQFRGELFNAFNMARFGLPDGNLSSSTYGRILSAYEPRDIQFGLKFLW
ncbi:MAG: hypothetical protein DMG06_25735, partial [Acidobacteria bacterium]